MAAPIGDLVADLFYQEHGQRTLFNGLLKTDSKPVDPTHVLGWRNVKGRQEPEKSSKSLLNRAEAEAVIEYLLIAQRELMNRQLRSSTGERIKTVAIITPYSAQKRLINQMLLKHKALQQWMYIEVDTVDSFQGSEADIVLYSTVRTQGNISFLLDRQRLNVACSRARENLVFFGDSSFLISHEKRNPQPLFGSIFERCRTIATMAVTPPKKIYTAQRQ